MRDRALSQSDESSAIVLIVEDDPDIVEILRLYLAGSGYVVLSASDGVEGLRRSAVSALTLPWSTS